MLCKKKLSPKRRFLRRVICTILIITILLSTFIELVVKTQLTDVIKQQTKTLCEKAVNLAVTDFLTENADIGERLCAIMTDDSGAITAIRTDPAVVNLYKAWVNELAQSYIERLEHSEGISVPLGSFSGLVFLAELGPDVRLHISSRQTVTCDFASSFTSAGINQTLHHIAMTVDVEVSVYNPYRIAQKIRTSTTFEVAQTVIVGSVPTYGGVLSY